MDIKRLEPFAWGYAHSPKPDVETRIAHGILTWAKEIPLTLDVTDWFVSPLYRMSSQAVSYERAEGIVLRDEVRRRNISEYPEDEEIINVYYDWFRPYETLRIISKHRTPLQEKLEVNKCCWAAGGGHSNPDYEMLLRVGTKGIRDKIALFRKIHTDKADLYDAFEMTLDAFEIMAKRLQDLARERLPGASGEEKTVLERLVRAFDNIPRNAPRDFFEACEFFWLAFTFLDVDSPGLFDYALGRYYENDDEKDRYACLEKLWELFHKTRTWNLCVGRSEPDGLVIIAVEALDFHGLDLAEPLDVVALDMHAEAGRVGGNEQRVLLATLAPQRLVMRPAFLCRTADDPACHRRTLLVVGEVRGESLGPELDLAGRRVERPVLGIFVEAAHSGRKLIPIGGKLREVEALLLEGLPVDLLGEARLLEAILDPLVLGHA